MKLKKYLIKNLKMYLITSKKDTLSKKSHEESKIGALSRNLKTNVKSPLSRIYTKYLKRCLIKEPN